MITFNDHTHAREIARRAGVGFDPEVDQVISRVTPAGKFWGGVLFTNFTTVAIQMHMAGDPGWINRPLIWACFDYPFRQLGVDQVLATVPSTNQRSLEITLRLGFSALTLIPAAVKDGDMLVLSMSRKECGWLRMADRYLRKAPDRQELAA